MYGVCHLLTSDLITTPITTFNFKAQKKHIRNSVDTEFECHLPKNYTGLDKLGR